MPLLSKLKLIAAMSMPELAARRMARRRMITARQGPDSFSDPAELTALVSAYDIVSFDLFDTLVTRSISLDEVHMKTSEFATAFLTGDDGPLPEHLIGHSRGWYQNMLKQRGMKSAAQYRNEIDLTDVFDNALAPYIADARARGRAVEALIRYEIETETRCLSVIPEMRGFLEKLRGEGKTLILISDMYFPERHIKQLLTSLGLLELFDHVFVSATVGLTKNSGMMFPHVDATLELAKRKRIHLGDNWMNDVHQPRANGWDALQYYNPDNEARKCVLEQKYRLKAHLRPAAQNDVIRQLLAKDNQQDCMRLLAAGFTLFARHILSQAIQEKASRIFFLTRDGTIFQEFAEQFITATGAGKRLAVPEMQELAISRATGVILNYPELEAPHWKGFLLDKVQYLGGLPASLRTVMRIFLVDIDELDLPNEVAGEVAGILATDDPETDIDLDELRKRPEILHALHRALCGRRDRVRAYLGQLGLFDRNEKILLVDIGYSGTVLKELSEYCFHMEGNGQPVRSRVALTMLAANRFFPGNLGRMHPRISMNTAWMLNTHNRRHRAAAVNFAWLEPFAVDRTRGRLLDYLPDASGRLVPRFAGGFRNSGGLERSSILAAGKRAEEIFRLSALPERHLRRAVSKAIVRQFSRPNHSAIREMRSLTHHAGLSEIRESGVIGHIRLRHLFRDLSGCLRNDHWVQGSLRASGLGLLVPVFNKVFGLISQ